MNESMSMKPAHLWHRQMTVLHIAQVGVRIMILPILLGLVLSGAYVGQAFISSALFTELLGSRDKGTIVRLLIALSVFLVAIPLIGIAKAYLLNRIGLRLKVNLRKAILTHVDRRGPMRMSSQRAGNLESLMVDGVEAIEPYYGTYLPQIAITTITAGSICVWIGTVSPLAGIVLFVCAVITFLIPRVWDKVLAEKGQEHWDAYAELNSDFVDAMTGMTTLKAFGAANQFGKRLARQSKELLRSTLTQLRVSLGETGASSAMMVLGPAFALLIAIVEVRSGNYPITKIFFITLLSIEVFRPLRDLANAFHAGYFGLSAADQIYNTLSVDSTIPNTTQTSRKTLPESAPATIGICELSYQYESATTNALEKISLTVEQGQFMAIVGGSGSGKSTLLGLMLGFDAPKSGTVTIGKTPTAELDIVSTVALVPQNPVIFPGTVESILKEANPRASHDDLLQVLSVAQATDFHAEASDEEVLAHRQKAQQADLELMIEESGANISGGQKQRLAIARALIRKPRVMILDESTSALDSQVEKRIITSLRKEFPTMTLILVTHRMDVALIADTVTVLRKGRISEYGSPDGLLARKGEFAAMVDNSTGSLTGAKETEVNK